MCTCPSDSSVLKRAAGILSVYLRLIEEKVVFFLIKKKALYCLKLPCVNDRGGKHDYKCRLMTLCCV